MIDSSRVSLGHFVLVFNSIVPFLSFFMKIQSFLRNKQQEMQLSRATGALPVFCIDSCSSSAQMRPTAGNPQDEHTRALPGNDVRSNDTTIVDVVHPVSFVEVVLYELDDIRFNLTKTMNTFVLTTAKLLQIGPMLNNEYDESVRANHRRHRFNVIDRHRFLV
jgi:hypothetical protein